MCEADCSSSLDTLLLALDSLEEKGCHHIGEESYVYASKRRSCSDKSELGLEEDISRRLQGKKKKLSQERVLTEEVMEDASHPGSRPEHAAQQPELSFIAWQSDSHHQQQQGKDQDLDEVTSSGSTGSLPGLMVQPQGIDTNHMMDAGLSSSNVLEKEQRLTIQLGFSFHSLPIAV